MSESQTFTPLDVLRDRIVNLAITASNQFWNDSDEVRLRTTMSELRTQAIAYCTLREIDK